ncbi:GatB/YqeY domain-containing protein [Edaphobacter flagellatus]|uniref:GatB/YqeY domain-containing protein n=1 Tax=Edaphobacter flagellatus TaxID=1933044 RepID=UPI0021B1E821|nr:GatB/YqeY domain-containing protein [Edaphobacter flagellatus]
MSISKKIDADIIAAMKAKEEHRLTTLRMVKSALKNKAIDKRADLTDQEESAILTTLIKQRKESVESFTKGNRPELAEKEQVEIALIETYLPQAAGEDQLRPLVTAAIAELAASTGNKPTPRDMGTVMKATQQKIAAAGIRADGKLVSELVKTELAK